MKTKIVKKGNSIVVVMNGKLDYETQILFQNHLDDLMHEAKSHPKKIIFNLENLEFVGSSGIGRFIQALKDFNHQAPTKPRFCHVKNEFKQMLKGFAEDENFEIYETEDRAIQENPTFN
jgi:anti-anti-sigma factor